MKTVGFFEDYKGMAVLVYTSWKENKDACDTIKELS